LLREHSDAVEADLQRFYGVSLAEFWQGGMSLRRLYVLVSSLPPGSAVWAIQNGLPPGWSLTDVLLADVYHALTGQRHPAFPESVGESSDKTSDLVARLKAQRARVQKSKEG